MQRRNRGQYRGLFINACTRIPINVGHIVDRGQRGIWSFLARWGWTSWRQGLSLYPIVSAYAVIGYNVVARIKGEGVLLVCRTSTPSSTATALCHEKQLAIVPRRSFPRATIIPI